MNEISINDFDDNEKKILEKLNREGKGYVVGGAVRDILLGLKPKDIDFATNLNYDELKKIFTDYSPKETGKSFGVLRIKIDDRDYEIAKFRQDLYEEKNEKKIVPEDKKVIFVDDIRNDLVRRDFTINAMAYNEEDGLIDLFNGQKDLKDKTINFVGMPEERIKEDPVRMLRAFRFMSKLNFNLSSNTIVAIKNKKSLLKEISQERITLEFSKLLLGENVKNTLMLMKDTGVLELIIPEIKATYDFNQYNPHHTLDLFSHIVSVVEKVPTDTELRYAALLHDIGKPAVQTFDDKGIAHYRGHDIVGEEMAKNILTKMKIDSKTIENISNLVRKHMALHRDLSDKKMNKLLSEMGYEQLLKLIQHSNADNESKNSELVKSNEILYEMLNKAQEKNMQLTVNDLAIDGNDLMSLGFRGKEIGKIKKELLGKYLNEEIKNDRESLLKYLKNYKIK